MMSNPEQCFSSNSSSSNPSSSNLSLGDRPVVTTPGSSGSLLDSVVVFPDGSVMWVPDGATAVEGSANCAVAVKCDLERRSPPINSLQNQQGQTRPQPSTAIRWVKQAVRQRYYLFKECWAEECCQVD
jgi:hypothetical protein